MGAPLYDRIVAGYEPNERGEDAVELAGVFAASAGGAARSEHVEGEPAGRALLRLAERGEADLIALGSTHRAAIGSVAPGSVAEYLLSRSPVPIAIAPRGYARARAVLAAEGAGEEADDVPAGSPLPLVRQAMRVVAVGFNDTPESQAALREAARLAARARATIWVVGVSEPVPRLPQAAAAAAPAPGPAPERYPTRRLADAVHEAAADMPEELRALPVHERGDPVERLLERASEGLDLLVLGSRGFGPLMRVLLGSVSARVIRRAPCPVLVVPRPG